MKELRNILTFDFFETNIDKILINIVMATIFVWLVYTIQNIPCFG